MAKFIELTLVENEATLINGEKFYDLDGKIALNLDLIESLKPATYRSLSTETVKKSEGKMNGTPTLIRMTSGHKYVVAETISYIENGDLSFIY